MIKFWLIFFLKFLFFSLLVSVCCILIYGLYYDVSYENIPPPEISDSYSLNDKLNFIRNKEANIIAIGSSMSLNNISSDVVVNKVGKSYINASSWGLNMMDVYKILRMYAKYNKLKTLMIASNIIDFNSPSKKMSMNELNEFIGSKSVFKFHLSHFHLRYYFENCKYDKKVKSGRNFSSSLVYDKYGGVPLDAKKFEVNHERWKDPSISKIVGDLNYQYLDSISIFCKYNGIQLLFFQTPTRQMLFNDENLKILNTHIIRIRKMMKKNQHYFINSNLHIWDDSLFVDGTHLNAVGAKLFTEYCFEKLNTR